MSKPGKITRVTFCEMNGHDFQDVGKRGDHYLVEGNDTKVMKTYVCLQCLTVETVQVATWKNFVPKSQKKRGEDG